MWKPSRPTSRAIRKAYAGAVVQRILETTRNLESFPRLGRIVPEIGKDSICERFVYSYRVVYRVDGGVVTVAAVIHGKRLLGPVKGRIER
jgi:plasmid stabilization system protein ParE